MEKNFRSHLLEAARHVIKVARGDAAGEKKHVASGKGKFHCRGKRTGLIFHRGGLRPARTAHCGKLGPKLGPVAVVDLPRLEDGAGRADLRSRRDDPHRRQGGDLDARDSGCGEDPDVMGAEDPRRQELLARAEACAAQHHVGDRLRPHAADGPVPLFDVLLANDAGRARREGCPGHDPRAFPPMDAAGGKRSGGHRFHDAVHGRIIVGTDGESVHRRLVEGGGVQRREDRARKDATQRMGEVDRLLRTTARDAPHDGQGLFQIDHDTPLATGPWNGPASQ